MKNPITYTKEDIYEIAYLGDVMIQTYGGMGSDTREFIKGLIDCLTPEERENEYVHDFLKYCEETKG